MTWTAVSAERDTLGVGGDMSTTQSPCYEGAARRWLQTTTVIGCLLAIRDQVEPSWLTDRKLAVPSDSEPRRQGVPISLRVAVWIAVRPR
jgi:hypothetical protein